MNIPAEKDARTRLWLALGNQPGVGAWFSVWTLSRESRSRNAVERTTTKPVADSCAPRAKGSPA